jgi:hypothetical protein
MKSFSIQIVISMERIRRRHSMVDPDFMDQFPYFLLKMHKQKPNGIMETSLKEFKLTTLLKLIFPLRNSERLTWSDLFHKSNIIMKRSFLNYVGLCKEFDLITSIPEGPRVFYYLTPKGNAFYSIFQNREC